ncbi:MAG: DUF2065 domain-containing protein [Desulfobulbaceae bacterium]|nr:MAG: DUF2065 domain-containing protein [Desulfobulbaceae bacterium]
MKLFLLLIGLVFILEGLPYAASPDAMRKWLVKLADLSSQQLRVMGFSAVGLGLLIIWIVQKTNVLD